MSRNTIRGLGYGVIVGVTFYLGDWLRGELSDRQLTILDLIVILALGSLLEILVRRFGPIK